MDLAQHLTVNIQLKTGATTETVEVSTAPPLLQTEEGSVGQVITERSVNSLPLNGRNFTFLAQLGAGVNTPQADTRGNANNQEHSYCEGTQDDYEWDQPLAPCGITAENVYLLSGGGNQRQGQ